ncbi:serine/threonine-protein kinase pim-2-like [Pimephales promelas]|nr:serine/threonine-protein kinase pim-2-like [Pimephales promelas]
MMAHMGERDGSGCSRTRGPSSTQTAGLEVWRLRSVDLPPLSSGSSGSSVFTEQAHMRKWQSRSQLSPDDEFMCPPLPGQVPVEPTVTSTGPTAQGAVEASPANRSSTGKPTLCRKRKGIRGFLRRVWKAMRHRFGCCCHCSAVDDVEPFAPPADLDPEPDPDHSAVKPNNESFESLFNIGEMIGSGGFGRVFKGTRKFDGKKVAIKEINKIDNNRYLVIPGHPEPLVTEVALLLLMRQEPRSPYIIQLYEWFEHPEKFTLVMEYPEPCESLLDFIRRNSTLHETTARVIMRQAVLAVQHCIERGVFHNDVHADNFLLMKNKLEVKLIDFGCGQLLSSDGYESSKYLGLPDSCPPEAYTGPRFHAIPTNVWSLGVVLYEMVNACSPFFGRTDITQGEVIFENSNLSKECRDLIIQLEKFRRFTCLVISGNNTLAVLGAGLELVT